MKFALYGLHRGSSIDPGAMLRLALLAEQVGFEALWVGDHIALPQDLGNAAELPRLEALIGLSYLAAVTTRVRLGVGVVVLPQRQPVLLAKQLSSIDILSKGRLTIGIGVGYVEAELQALGASLADRGKRTDEYLLVMKALWMGLPSFAGQFISFNGIVQLPAPVQKPHPPIVIGGNSPAAYRRAVRVGHGWYGWQLGLEETRAAIAALEERATHQDRPPELGDLEITITPNLDVDVDSVRRYAELGVDRLALQAKGLDEASVERLIVTTGERLIGRA